jgi:hypothetical protein
MPKCMELIASCNNFTVPIIQHSVIENLEAIAGQTCQNWWWWCWWDETTSLNCGHDWACYPSPRWYTSVENRGGISGNPTSSHLVARQGELAKEMMNLALWCIFVYTLKGIFLTCCKILQHGANGFTFSAKEGMLQIFVALKNPSPSAWFECANLWFSGKQLMKVNKN